MKVEPDGGQQDGETGHRNAGPAGPRRGGPQQAHEQNGGRIHQVDGYLEVNRHQAVEQRQHGQQIRARAGLAATAPQAAQCQIRQDRGQHDQRNPEYAIHESGRVGRRDHRSGSQQQRSGETGVVEKR